MINNILLTDNIIFYIKNQNSKISNYRKVVETRLKNKSEFAFLHTSNKQVEHEMRNTIPFMLIPTKMKYSSMNKNVHDMYNRNYKILAKDFKEELHKLRHISCSYRGMNKNNILDNINISKISGFPTLAYKFNTIPNKIPAVILWLLTHCP